MKAINQLPLEILETFYFPNIEFRTDKQILIDRNPDRYDIKKVNFHVLFSKDVTVQDIEDNFLHTLHFSFFGERKPLTVSNLTEFGRKLKEHNSYQGSDFLVGCNHASVDMKEVRENLENDSKFKGQFLICLADDGLSRIPWDSPAYTVRRDLVGLADCIFASNQKS